MDVLQFYPTPKALAEKAWSMFRSTSFTRVLEPSAGRGDLLSPMVDKHHWGGRLLDRVDVVEINLEHHPVLREKGFRVVDVDFLQYRGAVGYSHIIMNPPFRNGVDHVLHAWELLKDGELVAILNAETIDNPNSAKRQLLVKLIEEHGEVEYVESAFEDPDTLRKTPVRVALVHLTRKSSIELPPIWDLLKEDKAGDPGRVAAPQELALPNSTIKNLVRAFNAAVEAMKSSVIAQATANYYAGMIKTTVQQDEIEPAGLGAPGASGADAPKITFSRVQEIINSRYDELKESAWRSVLNAADFSSRFTNKVRADLEREIDRLITMEFTEQNIHALLGGLLANKTELDMQSIEDAFDTICRYHTENREYYRGWKSNDKHRMGWRIKAKRFILPHMAASFTREVSWDALKILDDLDRAFALLDGKLDPEYSMRKAIEQNKDLVLSSRRVQSDYFEFRFYKGAGTMHFFPTRPDLVERMNRIVGQRRKWLPDQETAAPESFWAQYEAAGKVTKEMERSMNEDDPHHWKRRDEAFLAEHYETARGKLGIPQWDGLEQDKQVDLLLPENEAA